MQKTTPTPEQIELIFRLLEMQAESTRKIVFEAFEQVLKNPKPAEPSQSRKTMTVDEVAAFTGLAKGTIYIKTMRGLIPHYKRDKRVFFDRNEIEAWLLENKRITTTEADKQADKYLAQKASRQKR